MKADIVKITFDRKTGKEIKREKIGEKEVSDSFFTAIHETQFPDLFEKIQEEERSKNGVA
ncbi:hypothetical protein SDC9_171227 [bioreactor metagenome]|uniref:Uncharacterized protein n=1 Tax=bioreactor metagenome TaxID=1076179 RepID=A0A645GIW2_9ZZZZ